MSRRYVERARGPTLAVPALAIALAGCGEVDSRPQVLLTLDTDAPVTGQLEFDADIVPDAAIDTLRVDILDEAGNVRVFRSFAVSQASDWPLSFGVTPADSEGNSVRLRIRAFRAALARTEVLEGLPVLEPAKGASIDRMIRLDMPDVGVRSLLVDLSFECMGTGSIFGKNAQTCVDAAHVSAGIGDGIGEIGEEEPSSQVGSSPLARYVPCEAAPQGTVCIPGGFTFLGHQDVWGMGDVSIDARPLRAVLLSPFAMDRTEVTVARFQELLQDNPDLPEPSLPSAAAPHCTWSGPTDTTNANMPVNCVLAETATLACESAGGSLPSEAQWEYVARGRGMGWIYPWGDRSPPDCCVAGYARVKPAPELPPVCGDVEGPEPVGSHPRSDECEGLGDESRDGVLDLAGNVSEIVRDKLQLYGEVCWSGRGPQIDPVCEDDDFTTQVERGGQWGKGASFMLLPARRAAHGLDVATGNGFRCVYEVGP